MVSSTTFPAPRIYPKGEESPMDFDYVMTAIKEVGVVTVLLFALIYVIYKVSKLVIELVLVPIARAHVAFLDSLVKAMDKNTEVQEKISSRLDSVCGYNQNGIPHTPTSLHQHS